MLEHTPNDLLTAPKGLATTPDAADKLQKSAACSTTASLSL
jgi:hypothetical protein